MKKEKEQKQEKRKIKKEYLPANLSKSDREKQKTSILNEEKRPKVDFKSKRSTHVIKFEKKYGTKISNKKFIHENIITYTGQKKIIDKGIAAYYNSGSRPNQTPQSWSLARLASVIMGGKAREIDKNEWLKYKR